MFKTVISDYVDRTWDFVGHGDTYHKTRTPNIESQSKSASSDLNATVYTDTEQTVTINVHDACAIKHEDIAQLLSRNNMKEKMTANMGYSLARAVDVQLAALAHQVAGLIQLAGRGGAISRFDQIPDSFPDL